MRTDSEPPQDTSAQRRRIGIALALILGCCVLWDIFYALDLFHHGSQEEIDHASERIRDPLLGPNAP